MGSRETGFTRRTFLQGVGATLAALALPEAIIGASQDTLDGWVTLARPCSTKGLEVAPDMVRSLFEHFRKPIPVSVEFDGQMIGWISDVRLVEDTLLARLELPSFNRSLLTEYRAIVPAFTVNPYNRAAGGTLVEAALTQSPMMPGTELPEFRYRGVSR